MDVIVIGLVGPKGCGKSTIAKTMVDIVGHDAAAVVSFAEPIRRMVEAGLGIPQEIMKDPIKKEEVYEQYGASPRKILQTLGTEWGREIIHPDIWVNAWKSQAIAKCASLNPSKTKLIICDDLRFQNEAEMIDSMAGVIVRIERTGASYGYDLHPSEDNSKMESDVTFENNVPESKFKMSCGVLLDICLKLHASKERYK